MSWMPPRGGGYQPKDDGKPQGRPPTGCPHIEPELVAYADQRIARTAQFVDRLVAELRDRVTEQGPDHALAVCSLSKSLDEHLTAGGAMSDALALALRRLAAHQ